MRLILNFISVPFGSQTSKERENHIKHSFLLCCQLVGIRVEHLPGGLNTLKRETFREYNCRVPAGWGLKDK